MLRQSSLGVGLGYGARVHAVALLARLGVRFKEYLALTIIQSGMSAPLLSLDLFSGIGGLTLSLIGLVKPLVYCDINPDALAVLHERMR